MTGERPSRTPLYIAFGTFGAAFAIYTALWFWGAGQMKAEIAKFAEREASQGRSLTYTDITTDGYPFSLRGTVANAAWVSEQWGSFQAEELLIVAVPYQPNRIVLAPRGEQTARIDDKDYDVASDDLRFSLQRNFAAAEGHGVVLTGEDQTITVKDAIINRRKVAEGTSYALSVQGLDLGDKAGTVFHTIDSAAGQEGGTTSIPFLSMSVGRAVVEEPTLLLAEGELKLTPGQRPNGEVKLTLAHEDALLDLLVDGEILDKNVAKGAGFMIGTMKEKDQEELSVPLTISDGKVRAGFVPLGRLPAVPN
ncbi:MAG: DUF2125 domain-containing protein [Parvularculaceae bacterium]|nr:DUF2125 domain-containing protein [Parvularculaceae bacterium]